MAMSERERLVRDLFRAIENGATGEALARYFDPNAEQIEYPSLMRPAGGQRSVDGMLAGAELGARLIADQSYEPHVVIDDGERLAVRFTWRGTLRADAAGIPAGTALVAHVAAFFEFREGRVLRQSSYDCYEPVAS